MAQVQYNEIDVDVFGEELVDVGEFAVESRGETRTERVFSLVLLGDLVSLYLAVLRGVDPTPVQVIERLKGELARG